jgi:hypothetical protein
MSTHLIDESTITAHPRSFERARDVLRAILIGLIPLGLLIIAMVATLLLTTLARLLFASSGFFAQQQAAVIVLIVGLLLAIVVFSVAIWRVLQRVAVWQQGEGRARASAALWALGATALVIVLPVLLALLLPQHPAP